jgi:hypothetical protein
MHHLEVSKFSNVPSNAATILLQMERLKLEVTFAAVLGPDE